MKMMTTLMVSPKEPMAADSQPAKMTQQRYLLVHRHYLSRHKHNSSAKQLADGLMLSIKNSFKVSINLQQIFKILIYRMCSFEDFWERLEKGRGVCSNSFRCLNPLSCTEVFYTDLEEAQGRFRSISESV
jgi:hypothetical protein